MTTSYPYNKKGEWRWEFSPVFNLWVNVRLQWIPLSVASLAHLPASQVTAGWWIRRAGRSVCAVIKCEEPQMCALWPDIGSQWFHKLDIHLYDSHNWLLIQWVTQQKKRKRKTLNSHHCDDNNHKSMCHLFTHPCIFISLCRAATGKQEHVNTAVYFSSSRLSAAARTGTIILFTRCLRDGLPGRYLNLASSVGKFHEKQEKKKARHDHIDLHLGQKPQKVTVTVTVFWGKTGQQQGHRPFMPFFTWRVHLVGIVASHAVHVHNGRRGKTWLHQTFFINVWLCKVHNGW